MDLSETSILSFRIMLTIPPTFAFLRSDYRTTLPDRPNSLLKRERTNLTFAERIFMPSDDMTTQNTYIHCQFGFDIQWTVHRDIFL